MFNKARAGLHNTRVKLFNAVGGASQSGTTGPLSFFTQWFNPNNLVGELQQLEQYRGITYACISAIAEDVARIRFSMSRPAKDGTSTPVTDHAFLALLKNPNPTQSDYEFMEMTQTHIELTGEAFWYVPKGAITTKPKELWVMRPDLVQVAFDQETGEVNGYVYHKWNGRVQVPLDLDEVIHFKMPNPINPYRGMGTVQAGIVYIQTEQYASEFSRNFLLNNGTPAGIVNFKGTISDPEFQKVKRQWTREYSNVENAGKTAFVRQADVSYQKIGSTLQDIDLKELKNLTRDDIMFMFRVSKPILGITEDVNYASAQTAEYIFAKRVIDPKMNRIVDTLQTFYNKKYNDGLVVSYITPIPQNTEEKIAYYKAGINNWLTPNEVRALEGGLEAIEGGDVIRMPFNLSPIDANSASRLPASAETLSGTGIIRKRLVLKKSEPKCVCCDGNGEHDTGFECYRCDASGLESDAEGGIPCDGRADSPNIVKNDDGSFEHAKNVKTKKKVPKAEPEATVDDSPISKVAEDFRLLLVATAKAYTPQLNHAVTQAVARQRSLVLAQLTPTKAKAFKKKTIEDEIDYFTEDTDEAMQDAMLAITTELVNESGKYAMQLVGNPEAFTTTEVDLARIKARIAKVTGSYTKTTQDAMAKVISDSVASGAPITEMIPTIRNGVEKVFTDATGYRAERIARTEAIHEANFATNEAYIQSGVEKKEWYAGGPNPCEFCLSMDKTIVGTEDIFIQDGGEVVAESGNIFKVDYADVEAGNLHPNCIIGGQDIEAYDINAKIVNDYDGPVVELTFASGKKLTVTPNHKIATPNGWVKANLLNNGDNVLSANSGIEGMAIIANPNAEATKSLIDNVVIPHRVVFGSVPVSAVDFDGDEVFSKNVDIIFANGSLWAQANAKLSKFANDSGFSGRDVARILFPGICALHQFAFASLPTPSGIMSVLDDSSSLANRHSRIHEPSNFAMAPKADTMLLKSIGKDSTSNPDTWSQFIQRFSDIVSSDKIINVRNFNFSGHVYDLSTKLNFYTTNSIIVHNCECTILPVVELDQ